MTRFLPLDQVFATDFYDLLEQNLIDQPFQNSVFLPPFYSDMWSDPRLRDVVRQIGLVDAWKELGYADFCQPITNEADTDDFECGLNN